MASKARSKRDIHRKTVRSDVAKLERARRVLKTRTQTDTVDRALELVVDEAELARAITNLVVKGHGQMRDVGAALTLSAAD